MKRPTKTVIGVCAGMLTAAVILVILINLLSVGAFNKLIVKDIASFESPNGSYILIYQQLGAPQFPFGRTEVRLTLKDKRGRKINSIDTEILDDGANADEQNVESVKWGSDSVVVVLRASEMPDKTIELKYHI